MGAYFKDFKFTTSKRENTMYLHYTEINNVVVL